MFLVVIHDEFNSAYIEVVEHVKDYMLTKKPWDALMPFDTEEEAKEAIDLLIADGIFNKK